LPGRPQKHPAGQAQAGANHRELAGGQAMAEKDDLRRDNDRTAADIREDLAAQRESISDTVEELNQRLHESLDWRRYVSDHPLAAVGVASGAGFLVAMLIGRRRSPGERIADAIAGSFEDLTDGLREFLVRWPASAEKKKSGTAALTAALTSMAGRAAIDFVKRKASEATFGHRSGHNGGPRPRRVGASARPPEVVS